jgi:hypothetical protein
MTHAKLVTQAERLAEIREIVEIAQVAAGYGGTAPALIARLARLIEAEMLANDESGLVG